MKKAYIKIIEFSYRAAMLNLAATMASIKTTKAAVHAN